MRTRPTPSKRRHLRLWWLPVLLAVAAAYGTYCQLRPVGNLVRTVLSPPVIPAQVRVNLAWPPYGQAAVGAQDYGVLASHGNVKPSPMASLAKLVTILAVLRRHPLAAGQTGPVITMTAQDQAFYVQDAAADGSVVPVRAGEQITEYQAFQAMMLPSANNIADSMAVWAFGSIASYTDYANNMLSQLGLHDTHVADASGYSAGSVSSAPDLVRLGDMILQQPAITDIMAQKTATMPGVGTIVNLNSLLGQSGIFGIKTGNTNQAGGCFLGAAKVTVAGKPLTVITAIMDAPDLQQALASTLPLVQDVPSHFLPVQVVGAGQILGSTTTPWGARANVRSAGTISVTAYEGTPLTPYVTASRPALPATRGATAGSLNLPWHGRLLSARLYLDDNLPPPPFWWRLTHPF